MILKQRFNFIDKCTINVHWKEAVSNAKGKKQGDKDKKAKYDQ